MPLNHAGEFSELTDEQYQLIGKLTVEWSNIEYLMTVLLARLLLVAEFPARTFTDMSSASNLERQLQVALDLHHWRYGDRVISEVLQDRVKQTLDAISKARPLRNALAHYCWCRSNDQQLFGSAFLGNPIKNGMENKGTKVLEVSEMKQAHNIMHELTETLCQLTQDLPRVDEIKLLNLVLSKEIVAE